MKRVLILLLVFVVIIINGIVFNVMEEGHKEDTAKPAVTAIEK